VTTASFLFTDEKIFTMATPKNPQELNKKKVVATKLCFSH